MMRSRTTKRVISVDQVMSSEKGQADVAAYAAVLGVEASELPLLWSQLLDLTVPRDSWRGDALTFAHAFRAGTGEVELRGRILLAAGAFKSVAGLPGDVRVGMVIRRATGGQATTAVLVPVDLELPQELSGHPVDFPGLFAHLRRCREWCPTLVSPFA
jgi:hypothetical protein